MKTECKHKFVATLKKGEWKVTALSVNNRGGPQIETVGTTVFRCARCGVTREYPDFWESNYVVPEQRTTTPRVRSHRVQKRKVSAKAN